jgi:hypothetical protein
MRPLYRLAFLFAAAGTAAGCEDAGALPEEPPMKQAVLAGGVVTVAGPPGYCIDRRTLRDDGESGFALIAPCAHIAEGAATGGGGVQAAIVTVTAGPAAAEAGLPSPQALAELSGARLVSGATEDGFVLVHLEGGRDPAIPDGDPRHWRAALLQAETLVGLALYAPEGSEAAGREGGAMLREVGAIVRRLSAESGGT